MAHGPLAAQTGTAPTRRQTRPSRAHVLRAVATRPAQIDMRSGWRTAWASTSYGVGHLIVSRMRCDIGRWALFSRDPIGLDHAAHPSLSVQYSVQKDDLSAADDRPMLASCLMMPCHDRCCAVRRSNTSQVQQDTSQSRRFGASLPSNVTSTNLQPTAQARPAPHAPYAPHALYAQGRRRHPTLLTPG